MLSKKLITIAFLLLLISFSTITHAQLIQEQSTSLTDVEDLEPWNRKQSEPWHFDFYYYSQNHELPFKTFWKSITTELNQPNFNEWAGKYVVPGFTTAIVFNWSPNSGFVFAQVNTCLRSTIFNLNYGKVSFLQDKLLVFPQISQPQTYSTKSLNMKISSSYVPIKWKNKHCLVPENKLKDFCEYLVGNRSSDEMFSNNDEALILFKTTEIEGENIESITANIGDLIVPSTFQHYVKQPITAKILSIIKHKKLPSDIVSNPKSYILVSLVKIDAGKNQGVNRLTPFYFDSMDYSGYSEVIKIFNNYSLVKIYQYIFFYSDGTPVDNPISLTTGTSLTSKPNSLILF